MNAQTDNAPMKSQQIIEILSAHPNMSSNEVARILGCSAAWVWDVRSKAGLPPPNRDAAGKMCCPNCGSDDLSVNDSRPAPILGHASVRRRRKCASCGFSWTTYEVRHEWINPSNTRNEIISQLETVLKAMKAGQSIVEAEE